MDTKVAVYFVGKKSRLTHHRLLPIYVRVVINNKRFEAATHQHCDPSQWSPVGNRVKGVSDTAIQTNMALDEIRGKVYDYKVRIEKENREFNVGTLREKWFGQDRNSRTLLETVRLSILDLQRQVEKGVYKRSTLTKYLTMERHVVNFLKWRDNGTDVRLVDIRLPFAAHFVYCLNPLFAGHFS